MLFRSIAIRLLENDNLVSVHYLLDPCDMMLATAKGLAIRFAPKDIRPMGRSTQGVRGIRLAKDDDLIGAIPVTGEEEKVLMITEGGYGKCTLTGEYRPQTRGGKGLITYKVSEKTGKLVGASCLAGGQEIMIVNDAGLIIRISGDEIPLLGRSTQGVRIMRTQDGHVRDFSVICEETEITELAEAVVQQNLSVPDEVDEVDVSLDEEDEISSSDRGDEL